MNVLLLSTSDVEGGAARSTYRLHKGLQQIGVNSQMLVQVKSSDDSDVKAPPPNLRRDFAKVRSSLDGLPLKLYPQRKPVAFSCQWLPSRIANKVNQLNPDVVNLHWICDGHVPIRTISKLKKPLVWTLHDMWAFTGGCHYDQNCDRYKASCGSCPQLQSHQDYDLSHWIWQHKANAWKRANLTVVTPSKWLTQCSQSSSLFRDVRVETIPYGIDTQLYQPIDSRVARKLLNLPQDELIVLFGAVNPTDDQRKGFHLLQSALQELRRIDWSNQINLAIYGASKLNKSVSLSFPTYFLGKLHDDLSLALAYSAADVFVAPSIQDNLPNTVMEAITCGTPCAAFNIGGMSDLIDHQQNGYLAKPFEVDDLAKGIAWILEDSIRQQTLAGAAREKAQREFSLELQAQRYENLFQELIEQSRSTEIFRIE